MQPDHLRSLLDAVAAGRLAPADALEQLRRLPFADIGLAKIDLHRTLRCGLPEAVLGSGKSVEQIIAICNHMLAAGVDALVTRLEPAAADRLLREFPAAEHNALARTLIVRAVPAPPRTAAADEPFIAIVCAGTSDLPVAEEARVTAEFAGCRTRLFADVGVAGVHRLLAQLDDLRRAAALIVVAGMEGALPSVVGGLVAAPLVAVPTSVGYGANLGGVTALLAMLNSCAAGVVVTNIDNGFGAACHAARILNGAAKTTRE